MWVRLDFSNSPLKGVRGMLYRIEYTQISQGVKDIDVILIESAQADVCASERWNRKDHPLDKME